MDGGGCSPGKLIDDPRGVALRLARETGTSLVEVGEMEADEFVAWATELADQIEAENEAYRKAAKRAST